VTVLGGRIGVLLCHGFTGSPQSLRPWAEALAERGFSVELPLLPGHGTTWQHMNRTSWPQWYREVERALATLRTRCDVVVAAGLSMGGALALRLAEQHPDQVTALVLVNPGSACCRCCVGSCRRSPASAATSRNPA
jgi:carboxylesterase